MVRLLQFKEHLVRTACRLQLNRLRPRDQIRRVEPKQLDDGIGDTLVSLDNPNGIGSEAKLAGGGISDSDLEEACGEERNDVSFRAKAGRRWRTGFEVLDCKNGY